MARFPGWCRNSGPEGYSFGIYVAGKACPLDYDTELHEVLRQAVDLLSSGADTGFICGREHRVESTKLRPRFIHIKNPWVSAQISQRIGKPGFGLTVDLPFGEGREQMEITS